MTTAAKPHPRKADIKTREDLLRSIGGPLGAVNVLRRQGLNGDVLVVQLASSGTVPPDSRISVFQGFPVVYETVAPARGGWW